MIGSDAALVGHPGLAVADLDELGAVSDTPKAEVPFCSYVKAPRTPSRVSGSCRLSPGKRTGAAAAAGGTRKILKGLQRCKTYQPAFWSPIPRPNSRSV